MPPKKGPSRGATFLLSGTLCHLCTKATDTKHHKAGAATATKFREARSHSQKILSKENSDHHLWCFLSSWWMIGCSFRACLLLVRMNPILLRHLDGEVLQVQECSVKATTWFVLALASFLCVVVVLQVLTLLRKSLHFILDVLCLLDSTWWLFVLWKEKARRVVYVHKA